MNKKILFLILLVILIATISIIFVISSNNIFSPKTANQSSNTETPFSIEKIVLYSNASALNDYSNPWWNLNVYQYTDIAIYLKNSSQISNASTLKIDNIQFLEGPSLGEPFSTYISPLNLGKTPDNILSLENQSSIIYKIQEQSEEETFETPIYFNNFSSPLTFRYINKDIVKDYVLKSDNSSLTFDGTLLKKCLISVEDISCKISFDVSLIVSENEMYKYNISFPLPIEGPDKTIYDGSILETLFEEDLSIKLIK